MTVSNIERSEDLIASLRWGAKTALGLDAAIGTRQVSFSEPQYASSEYTQDNASIGISSGTGGVVDLGAGFRGQRTKYRSAAPGQTEPDQSDRQDFYVGADWVPSGASTVNARLYYGKIEYNLATFANAEGVTGSLVWAWKPTGLLNLRTTLSRDTGQESGYLRLDPGGAVSASDLSRLTNALNIRADYLVTGKVTLSGAPRLREARLHRRLHRRRRQRRHDARVLGGSLGRRAPGGTRLQRQPRITLGHGFRLVILRQRPLRLLRPTHARLSLLPCRRSC